MYNGWKKLRNQNTNLVTTLKETVNKVKSKRKILIQHQRKR